MVISPVPIFAIYYVALARLDGKDFQGCLGLESIRNVIARRAVGRPALLARNLKVGAEV